MVWCKDLPQGTNWVMQIVYKCCSPCNSAKEEFQWVQFENTHSHQCPLPEELQKQKSSENDDLPFAFIFSFFNEVLVVDDMNKMQL